MLRKNSLVSSFAVSCLALTALAQSGHEGMNMGGGQGAQAGVSSPYLKETMAAMDVMHKDMMDSAKLNGDADHDFMVMMIPHHQGALSMAEIYLKHGKDAKVKKLASQIISAQKKEIAQMEKWIKDGVGAKK